MHIKDLKEHYVGGYGKQANFKVSILNPNITTLHLNTGEESRVLVVDVDNPESEQADAVRKKIRRDDFIVYSSQYTLNDVFAGKCKFKVFYEYHGVRLPKKKNNTNVEIFYGKKNLAGFAGKRGDGYEYTISSLSKGEIKPLHFDINDVVEYKVEKFDLFHGKEKLKSKLEKEQNTSTTVILTENGEDDDILGHDKVSIREFQTLLMELPHIVSEIPEMVKKGDIITFPCLFPETHSDTKNANAYAFKKDGFYVAKCHGHVCGEHYWKLNRELKELVLNQMHFENSTGFGEFEEKLVLFKAPTGWGKTEAIAEEALKAINNREKILILLQSKEAIVRLTDRINVKSKGAFESLYQMGKIYIYTSENKSQEHEIAVEKANVIVSHHYYYKNAGNILTYYKDSIDILDTDGLSVIIDEAHTYVEMASRLDLEVGGLYKRDSFAGMELWTSNVVPLTANALLEREDDFRIITSCLDATMNDFHSVELKKQWKIYPQVDYLNIVQSVEENNNYELIESFTEEDIEYYVFNNNDVKPIKENNLENETEGINLLTDSAERVILAKSVGDEISRRHIGRITFTAFHSQILSMVLKKPRQVILTTATWEDYHNDIVSEILPIHKEEVKQQIDKVGKIILLRSNEQKPAKIRKRLLETTNDLNARSLLFFPTIEKAREIAKEYENTMLNDNGMYSIGKRKSSLDYIDNFVRNVTVAGLESSVAKGYNYLEEVDGNSKGFELLYFDTKPVSPTVIKKYFDKEGKVKDYQSDYKWSAFAQAIGRTFRQQKETLCIAMNNINDSDYMIIKNYLKQETKAEIIEDELNIMNIKISIPSFIRAVGFDELKHQLKDNRLFKKIYLEEKHVHETDTTD